MTRKARTDSLAGDRRAMEAAKAGPIEPPDHVRLRDGDRPYWDAIVMARARERWDELDLTNAANLARTMADIEKLQKDLDLEGHVLKNDRGTPVANPIHAVIETLTRRSVALQRTLHVHAEAKQGKAKLQGGALQKQRDAQQTLAGADDDLIARGPVAH